MRTRVRLQEPLQTIVGSPEFSTIDKSVRDESDDNVIRVVPLVTFA
jgi:hypothetical protein